MDRVAIERRRLAAAAGLLAAAAWLLMSFGGFVRVSGSGLGCPDWPVCNGRLVARGFAPMVEEIHRWIAGLLTIGVVAVSALVLLRHRTGRTTTPVIAAVVLLGVQIALGAVTVLLGNAPWTVVAHWGAASLFAAALVLLAVRLRAPAGVLTVPPHGSCLGVTFTVLTFGLLLAGSTVANTESHMACGAQFPLCNGAIFPQLNGRVVIHLVHRLWAVAMVILALWLWHRSRERSAALRRAAAAVVGMFLVQAALGIALVLAGENHVVEVLHSSVAALTWTVVCVLFALDRTPSRAVSPGGERIHLPRRTEYRPA